MSNLMAAAALGAGLVLALSGCTGAPPTQEQQARALDRAGDVDLVGEFQAVPAGEPIAEDAPGWDCRAHGNRLCGVQVGADWYVLDFATGTFVPR
jgi:hypothetical protein